MSVMSREEFEVWLEDHRDEALDRIEVTNLRLGRWLALFAASMRNLANEDDETGEEDLLGEF